MTVGRPFRVLVTGWRDWPDTHRGVIWRTLVEVTGPPSDHALRAGLTPAVIVVHGACPYGDVDLYAHQRADHVPSAAVEAYPAERGPRGQILGPARNSRMVNAGADVCLAFPGPNSRGTWDCVRKAVDADIPTHVLAWSTAWARAWASEVAA
jgi:hypothetical protein